MHMQEHGKGEASKKGKKGEKDLAYVLIYYIVSFVRGVHTTCPFDLVSFVKGVHATCPFDSQ